MKVHMTKINSSDCFSLIHLNCFSYLGNDFKYLSYCRLPFIYFLEFVQPIEKYLRSYTLFGTSLNPLLITAVSAHMYMHKSESHSQIKFSIFFENPEKYTRM